FALECVRLEPKHGWPQKVADLLVEAPLWQNGAQPAIHAAALGGLTRPAAYGLRRGSPSLQ
ncbi:MAG: hypothetical protein QOG17_475, partial [Gammaproteobacteria bacterium]|nr:hypothetical protein [Gammaproteobacteria bacterium]